MPVKELIEQIGGRERLLDIKSRIEMFGHGAGYNADEVELMARALLAVLDAQEKPSIEVEKMNVERQALIFWLKNEINLIESARDEIPFGLDEDGEMALKGIRTALSALEAKPVCYTGSGSMEAVKVGCEGYIWRDCENSHPIGLYTTPPVASAPDGWKLVPLEPTQRMIEAHIEGMVSGGATRAYRAMIAAAPAPGGDGGHQS